tara:strand:+ start:1878 stop:2075 length:198 start_codon:yes stop_codon:yes gene_type:complete
MSYREQEEEQTLDEFLRRENANDVIDDATRLQSLSNGDITFDQALMALLVSELRDFKLTFDLPIE